MEGLDTLAGMAGYEYEKAKREREEEIERQKISNRFSTMVALAHRVGKENGLNPFELFDSFLYHSHNTVTMRVGSATPKDGVVIHLARKGGGGIVDPAEDQTQLEYYVYDGSHFGRPVDSLGIAVYLTQKKE